MKIIIYISIFAIGVLSGNLLFQQDSSNDGPRMHGVDTSISEVQALKNCLTSVDSDLVKKKLNEVQKVFGQAFSLYLAQLGVRVSEKKMDKTMSVMLHDSNPCDLFNCIDTKNCNKSESAISKASSLNSEPDERKSIDSFQVVNSNVQGDEDKITEAVIKKKRGAVKVVSKLMSKDHYSWIRKIGSLKKSKEMMFADYDSMLGEYRGKLQLDDGTVRNAWMELSDIKKNGFPLLTFKTSNNSYIRKSGTVYLPHQNDKFRHRYNSLIIDIENGLRFFLFQNKKWNRSNKRKIYGYIYELKNKKYYYKSAFAFYHIKSK